MLNRETRFSVREDEVAAKLLDGEAIVINLATGIYYSMSGVGADIWVLLEDGRSLGEIAATLSAHYTVQPETVAADLEPLVQQLLAEQLVSPAAGPVRASATLSGSGTYQRPELQIYRDMEALLALDPPMPGLRIAPSPVDSQPARG